MRALVYHGPGQKAWEEVPDPEITDDGDVIVRVDAVTICGTDLHILKGDVPEVTKGRIVGTKPSGPSTRSAMACARSSLAIAAAGSRTSACTARPPRCTRKNSGSRTSRSPRAWWTPPPLRP